MKIHGLSIPELELDELMSNGECVATGCGSTEYTFENKRQRDAAAKKIAKDLRKMAADFERGDYSMDEDDE